jgi:NTP pyrophosphatase (non-canonical NTP hydrolase)
MDLKQYVADATRTESRIDEVKTNPSALLELLQAQVAIGSMLDQLKKNIFYGKPIDTAKFDLYRQDILDAMDYFRPIPGLRHATHDGLSKPINIDPRLFHAIIGAITEAAELGEALRKALDSESPDVINVLEEFGDINWYEAIAVDTLGGDFQQLLEKNIAKLKARFPDKFTSENAIVRDLEKERSILEEIQTAK